MSIKVEIQITWRSDENANTKDCFYKKYTNVAYMGVLTIAAFSETLWKKQTITHTQ
jgi:hypothetical protein